MASIFGIFILELLAFRWGTARLAQIGMTHGQHFLAVIYRGTLLTEIPDAHGHDVGGSVAAHGPEGANTEMGSLEKQPLDEVEKDELITDTVAAQIIGVGILEFGVVLHRYVPTSPPSN